MPIAASERFDERQQVKFVYGESFKLPYPVDEDPEFKDVIPFLDQDRTWVGSFRQRRGDLRCSVVSLGRSVCMDVNPRSWEARRVGQLAFHTPSEKIGGLLVGTEFEELDRTSNLLRDITPVLPPRSPVIVVENNENDSREGLGAREKVLENVGLVKRDVLVRAPTDLGPVRDKFVWRSRTPARRRGTETNFVDEGPKWRREWVRGKIQSAARDYRRAGFKPLNAYEMGERLRHSTNPPWDLGAAELGHGFEVLAPCGGCKWRVTKRGDWVKLLDCGDPECDGSGLKW